MVLAPGPEQRTTDYLTFVDLPLEENVSRYMRDFRGRVVQAPHAPVQADMKPEGKAATRRRNQIIRQQQKQLGEGFRRLDELFQQNPAGDPHPAADSCVVPRADRQDLAPVLLDFSQRAEHFEQQMLTDIHTELAMGGLPRARQLMVDAPYIPAEAVEEYMRTGMVILDDYGPVPREVWEDAKHRVDSAIEREMTGGAPIPRNTAPVRPAAVKPRMGLGLTRGILAAALLATMGTDKPKE
jgi:hypothetical protein